jgi:hypothetical protein
VAAYRNNNSTPEPKSLHANFSRFNANRVLPEDRIVGRDFKERMDGLLKLNDKVQHQLVARIKMRARAELLAELTHDKKMQMAGMEMKSGTYLVELHYTGPLGAPGRHDKAVMSSDVYKYLHRRSMQENPHGRVSAMPPKCKRVAAKSGHMCGGESNVENDAH